jgi:hypothetical protein
MPEQSQITTFAGEEFASRIEWDLYEWAFVEAPWETMLFNLRGDGPRPDVAQAVSGVLFGPASELRWRKKRDGQFHCVLIRDDGAAAGECKRLERLGARTMMLWGQPDGEMWWESRIPRAIVEYPKELSGKPVAMVGQEYAFEPSADEPPVTILRLVGFEEVH